QNQGGLRAIGEECAGYSGAECEEERRPRRNAIVVLLRFAAGCDGARAAGAICGAESGMTMTGISGAAAVRAADAMLQTLGGTEVILLFPAAGMPADGVAGLGLVDPGDDHGEQRSPAAHRDAGGTGGDGGAGEPAERGFGGGVVRDGAGIGVPRRG